MAIHLAGYENYRDIRIPVVKTFFLCPLGIVVITPDLSCRRQRIKLWKSAKHAERELLQLSAGFPRPPQTGVGVKLADRGQGTGVATDDSGQG